MSDNYPGAAPLRQQFAGALKATLAKPPVYAFCFFAILIVLASGWCFRSFNTWPDRYSAAGYYVSLFGFSYVMFELLRAKRLAEVAREHYDRAAGLMRTQHYQFCLQEAQNTWNVALIEWQNKLPTDSASHRFFRQRIASGWANSSRQRIASLGASHEVFPPWSTG